MNRVHHVIIEVLYDPNDLNYKTFPHRHGHIFHKSQLSRVDIFLHEHGVTFELSSALRPGGWWHRGDMARRRQLDARGWLRVVVGWGVGQVEVAGS